MKSKVLTKYFAVLLIVLIKVMSFTVAASADTSVKATVASDSEVVRDSEIVFSVSIAGGRNIKGMAVVPVFDDEAFELVSGSWTTEGGIVSDFNTVTGDGVIAFDVPIDIDGEVLTFTLRAKYMAPLGQETVFAEIIINDGSENRTVLSNSVSVEIKCDHSSLGWKSDSDNHWQECSCGFKAQSSLHEWDSGTVTKEPTTREKGEKTYKCNICDLTKTENIEKLDGNPNSYLLFIVLPIIMITIIYIFLVFRKKKLGKNQPYGSANYADQAHGDPAEGNNEVFRDDPANVIPEVENTNQETVNADEKGASQTELKELSDGVEQTPDSSENESFNETHPESVSVVEKQEHCELKEATEEQKEITEETKEVNISGEILNNDPIASDKCEEDDKSPTEENRVITTEETDVINESDNSDELKNDEKYIESDENIENGNSHISDKE